MDFELSNDQKEMFDLALKFAKNEIIPVAAKFDEEEKFPDEIIKKAWELGFVNTCIPTEYGGVLTGITEYCCDVNPGFLAKYAYSCWCTNSLWVDEWKC